MFKLYQGALNTQKIFNECYEFYKNKNCGAFITFVGIIRDDDNIEALSFDIYDVLLKKWFDNWSNKLEQEGVYLCLAHSIGNVKVSETSFFCAIISKQRKQALKYIDIFVEDFKANAPIWKYDVKDSKRMYAETRSKQISGSGLLA